MIWDVFHFLNEWEALDIRLKTIGPFVDRIVIVENSHTFTGKKRDFQLRSDLGIFKDVSSKIRLVHSTHSKSSLGFFLDPMDRENEFRKRAFGMNDEMELDPDGVVIYSDCDEIPAPAAVQSYRPKNGIVRLVMKQRRFRMDLQDPVESWCGPVIMPMSFWLNAPSPTHCRFHPTFRCIENAGWHLSFMGDRRRQLEKLDAIEHHCRHYADAMRKVLLAGEDPVEKFGEDYSPVLDTIGDPL